MNYTVRKVAKLKKIKIFLLLGISAVIFYLFIGHYSVNSSSAMIIVIDSNVTYEFKGCIGEWAHDLAINAIVKKSIAPKNSITINDPLPCGFSIKNPKYVIDNHTLILSYEYFIDGPVAACYCDYQSQYIFKKFPTNIESIKFISDISKD